MNLVRQREVIVEIERLQVVRKRARTSLIYCRECRTASDFIEIEMAAKLFQTPTPVLLESVVANRCHLLGENVEALICLNSLLETMRRLDEMNAKRRLK